MPLVREHVLCSALVGGGVFCVVGLFLSSRDLEAGGFPFFAAGVQVVGLLLALLFCALLCPFLEWVRCPAV